MKALKILVILVASLTLLAGSISIAFAAEKIGVKPTTAQSVTNLPILNPCPTGWHVKSGTPGKSRYSCVPDKPAPIKCPAGYIYFDNSEAGCFVGCNEIIK